MRTSRRRTTLPDCCPTAVEEYLEEREHVRLRLTRQPSDKHREYSEWLERHGWTIMGTPAWEASAYTHILKGYVEACRHRQQKQMDDMPFLTMLMRDRTLDQDQGHILFAGDGTRRTQTLQGADDLAAAPGDPDSGPSSKNNPPKRQRGLA